MSQALNYFRMQELEMFESRIWIKEGWLFDTLFIIFLMKFIMVLFITPLWGVDEILSRRISVRKESEQGRREVQMEIFDGQDPSEHNHLVG